MKVNKTIPPRQVEISLLTRCIATRRKYLRKILRLTKTKRDCTIFHRRLRNYSFVFIYSSLFLSFFFNLRENLVRGVYKIDGNYHGKLFNILTRNRKEDRR